MVELHIFDFDGTLFFSPTAEAAALEAALTPASPGTEETDPAADAPAVAARKLHGVLRNPVGSGGLGWYQSLHTLSPPAVPARPAEETWFVQPILAHMRAIVAARNAMVQKRRRTTVVGAGGKSTSAGSDASTKAEMPLLYVLTGRDAKYHDRIWTLLQHVGLDSEVEDVLLKPTETAGTVKYKLNQFFSLIQYHQPSRVFYYEDRVEQGGRLLAGMQALEEMLYSHTRDGTTGPPAQGCRGIVKPERVGVATFDAAMAVLEGNVESSKEAVAPCDASADPAVPSASSEAASTPAPSSSDLLQLHLPQPTVVPLKARTTASSNTEDGHLATIEAVLRASPYELLRDACYPVDRHVAFYGAPAAASTAAASTATGSSTQTEQEAAAAASAEARSAERQAQRWVTETVDFYNKQQRRTSGGGGGGSGRGGVKAGRGGAASSAAVYDACALRRAVTFAVPPRFVFVMVLVPAVLCGRCAGMLTNAQLLTLVRTLKTEHAAATAALQS